MSVRRTPLNFLALARSRPKPRVKNGQAVPETSSFYEEPKYRGSDCPTQDEIALMHRHFAATSQKKCRGVRSKRRLAGMEFEFSWDTGQHLVAGDGWSVGFFAMGTPEGWRYRYHMHDGDITRMRADLEQIRRRFDHYEIDFPFAVKIGRANHFKVKAWCAERYPEGTYCYHHAKWRFSQSELAVETKMYWG